MNDNEMLEKILNFSKESAIVNTKLVTDMTQICKQLDEQKITINYLVKRVGIIESKIESITQMKLAINTLRTNQVKLEKINADSRLNILEHFQTRAGERLEKIENLNLSDNIKLLKETEKRVDALELKPMKKLSESTTKILWIIITTITTALISGVVAYVIKSK